jgi:hypothetical protein
VFEIMSTISPPTNIASKGKKCIFFWKIPPAIIDELADAAC